MITTILNPSYYTPEVIGMSKTIKKSAGKYLIKTTLNQWEK